MEKSNNESAQKNQNKNQILEGRKFVGAILIMAGIIILSSSFVYYPLFLFLVASLIAIIGIGITYEFARNFYKSEFNIKRLIATIYMSSYTYIALLLFFFLMIFNGRANIFFILVIAPAAISDAISFYVGKKKGKKKIVKRISPGKTWLGTITGYLVSFLATLIILVSLFPGLEIWQIIMVSVLIPLLAFLGDLIESVYKRAMGIKDSGSIFRGHGGFLDRTDSFYLPIYAIYLWAFWFL